MIVPVTLGDERDYSVFIDEQESFTNKLKEITPADHYVFITNKTIEGIYDDQLKQWESELPATTRIAVEDGEKYKDMPTVMEMLDVMLGKKLDRKAVVIAFGGGVIGDMAGFAASLFLRGVRYVQVPTTLLSMVDSSVGGKTGVNHKMGKNLIGAFYQPKFVWIDTNFLKTLPEREYIAGCGEIFKYGFIGGEGMFSFIENDFKGLLNHQIEEIREAVKRSIEIKADVVSEDEKEAGRRALLNFGHTFGHALEKFFGYGGILHGEGIFWGIRCAVDLGKRCGFVKEADFGRYDAILGQLLYPELPKTPDIDELYSAMFSDKKVASGTIRFVVPTAIGESVVDGTITGDDVKAVMKEVFVQ